jgi:hypothetical protein
VSYRSQRSLCLVAALLAFTSGCGDGDEPWFPGKRLWETEHFRYYSYADDDSVCEAVIGRLEQHLADTRAYLGVSWPAGVKVDYFKYPNEEEFLRLGKCPTTAAACADGLHIHTTERVDAHELTHAYFNTDGLYKLPFLDEGLAEVMSCQQAKDAAPPPWRDIVTQEQDPNRRLGLTGAWLIGHLLEHYPRAQFLRWFKRVQHGNTPEQIDQEFEAVYGVSLDAMWQEVTDVAGDRIQCVFLEECSAERLKLDGSPTLVGERCDGSNRFRTLEVEQATNLALWQDLPGLNALSSCGELPATVSLLSGASTPRPETSLVRLDPGKYTFGASSFDGDALVEVKASAAPELGLTSNCDETAAFAFDESIFGDDAILDLTLPPAGVGDVWFLRAIPGEGKYLRVHNGTTRLATTQCLGCSDSCKATSDLIPLSVDAHGAATLRVEQVEPYELSTRITIEWSPPRMP